MVEEADTQTLFTTPQHDYTQTLLTSIPRIRH
ncbi:ABC transporter ATP-binding protein [Arthrobacter sp. RHLT1-20]